MNTAAILVIGNEILDGITLDTNSHWLTQQLKPLNFTVQTTIAIRDKISEITKTIHRLEKDQIHLIITTGGLGPTYDDMTLQGVATALNRPLQLNKKAYKIVERQYKHYYEKGVVDTPEITDARKKMTILPQGAIPLDNKAGGAPGVLLTYENTTIISLPGVPSELKWIFNHQVKPILKEKTRGHYHEKIVHLNLRDESTLAPIIDKVKKTDQKVYIKSMVKPYGEPGIRLWISAHGDNKEEIIQRVEKISTLLIELTQDQVQE